MGQKGGGKGKGGVMTQSLYAHMNKGNLKKKREKRASIQNTKLEAHTSLGTGIGHAMSEKPCYQKYIKRKPGSCGIRKEDSTSEAQRALPVCYLHSIVMDWIQIKTGRT
jgi:hypothetical protein